MAIASWFTSQKWKKMIKMVIFHSYVTWPKGSSKIVQRCQSMSNPHKPTIFGKKKIRLLKMTPLDVPKWLQLTSDYTPLRPAGKWKLEWIRRRWRCSCTSGVRSTGLTCDFLWFCHWSSVFIEDCPQNRPLPMFDSWRVEDESTEGLHFTSWTCPARALAP